MFTTMLFVSFGLLAGLMARMAIGHDDAYFEI